MFPLGETACYSSYVEVFHETILIGPLGIESLAPNRCSLFPKGLIPFPEGGDPRGVLEGGAKISGASAALTALSFGGRLD